MNSIKTTPLIQQTEEKTNNILPMACRTKKALAPPLPTLKTLKFFLPHHSKKTKYNTIVYNKTNRETNPSDKISVVIL
jgi:hypothetical protein